MIIVKLHGGLGNQLFQYAFGQNLGKLKNIKVRYDISYFSLSSHPDVSLRRYQLDKFGLEVKTCKSIWKQIFLVGNKLGIDRLSYYNENNFDLDTQEIKSTRNGFYEGYWQSYLFFKEYKNDLLKSLSNPQIDEINQKCLNDIKKSNSVSLHVRRGDYLNPKVELFMKNPLDYYFAAIDKIIKIIEKPHFYVFSDDLTWVQDNLKGVQEKITFLDFNQNEKAYLDLFLMSQCKHNIIANSTFSWWGAFLNKNLNKVVIAPREWELRNNLIYKNLDWLII